MTAVAIMNRNPTRRVSSSRALGSAATTAAPIAGTATIDVRIGNPTRPGRYSSSANIRVCIWLPTHPHEHDPAEQHHGAGGDAQGVVADVTRLQQTQPAAGV